MAKGKLPVSPTLMSRTSDAPVPQRARQLTPEDARILDAVRGGTRPG